MALYSHDTQGLGHVRRNALIAAALVADEPNTDVLLLAGVTEATALPLPPRTDMVTLPGVAKNPGGGYRSRSMSMSLDDIVTLRSQILDAALASFTPDLLIVDKVARGALGELDRSLAMLRDLNDTRSVLGIRDVLDDAPAAIREWDETRSTDAVDELYDRIWVYGDPSVFDPADEYRWPASVTAKVDYTGYLVNGRVDLLPSTDPSQGAALEDRRPYVLGLVGGGQDGAAVATAFADAPLPPGHRGVLVTGPFLAPEVRRTLKLDHQHRDDLLVLDFVTDVPDLVNGAAAIVSMGGYNSVCELLGSEQPALLVPRVVPRREQALRADRLRQAGLVDVLDPAELTPDTLGGWLAQGVQRPGRQRQTTVDFDGLARVAQLAGGLLGANEPPRAQESEYVAV